jgi:hypothetical protein
MDWPYYNPSLAEKQLNRYQKDIGRLGQTPQVDRTSHFLASCLPGGKLKGSGLDRWDWTVSNVSQSVRSWLVILIPIDEGRAASENLH